MYLICYTACQDNLLQSLEVSAEAFISTVIPTVTYFLQYGL